MLRVIVSLLVAQSWGQPAEIQLGLRQAYADAGVRRDPSKAVGRETKATSLGRLVDGEARRVGGVPSKRQELLGLVLVALSAEHCHEGVLRVIL